jgi:hypothetical protein
MGRFVGMVLVCSVALSGCGDGEESVPAPVPPANQLAFETGEFDVEPGDIFECFYLPVTTTEELAVNKAVGVQGPGGHHISVYYTDVHREPGHHPCIDAEMINWHLVMGAGGEGQSLDQDQVSLPDGIAMKLPEGMQIVLQAHYINATGQTQRVNDRVVLTLLEPAEVDQYANTFVTNDEAFEIPPASTYTITSECTVQTDVSVLLMVGHMHERGSRYTLERIDESGATLATIYDEAWLPQYTSHPPVLRATVADPMVLAKGTHLRQTCTWQNDMQTPLLFPDEMCLSFSFYLPDKGELFCDMQPVAPGP